MNFFFLIIFTCYKESPSLIPYIFKFFNLFFGNSLFSISYMYMLHHCNHVVNLLKHLCTFMHDWMEINRVPKTKGIHPMTGNPLFIISLLRTPRQSDGKPSHTARTLRCSISVYPTPSWGQSVRRIHSSAPSALSRRWR